MNRVSKVLKLLAALLLCYVIGNFAGCTINVNSTKTKKDNPYLTFKGNEAFSLGILIVEESGFGKYWDGTVEYSTDKKTWNEWDEADTKIPAVASDGSYYVYLRGKGNTTFAPGVDLETNTFNGQTALVFTEADYDSGATDEETLKLECTGKITALLDYEALDTVVMGDYCFGYLFHDCTALTKAPELPSKTLSLGCYYKMFDNC